MGHAQAHLSAFFQGQVLFMQAHKSKYDEAGHCISYGKGGHVASGGADGVIKVFGV